jgi:hypothetical protein
MQWCYVCFVDLNGLLNAGSPISADMLYAANMPAASKSGHHPVYEELQLRSGSLIGSIENMHGSSRDFVIAQDTKQATR